MKPNNNKASNASTQPNMAKKTMTIDHSENEKPTAAQNVNGTQRHNADDEYSKKVEAALATLVPGKDFGQIPGIKGSVLFRCGLVKIVRSLQYRFSTKLVDKMIVDGIIAYSVEATIVDSDGCIIAQELGSSNSGEQKFSAKGLSSDNVLVSIASTRALRSCVKDILVR